MKTKDYCNKTLDREQIERLDTAAYYLPDDYNLPCFHIYIPQGEYESDEVDLAFYIEILIDDTDVIQKIEKECGYTYVPSVLHKKNGRYGKLSCQDAFWKSRTYASDCFF